MGESHEEARQRPAAGDLCPQPSLQQARPCMIRPPPLGAASFFSPLCHSASKDKLYSQWPQLQQLKATPARSWRLCRSGASPARLRALRGPKPRHCQPRSHLELEFCSKLVLKIGRAQLLVVAGL